MGCPATAAAVVAPELPEGAGLLLEAARRIEAIERDKDMARVSCATLTERLTRVRLEAEAIAADLGSRGLLDIADDVRMLARLAR